MTELAAPLTQLARHAYRLEAIKTLTLRKAQLDIQLRAELYALQTEDVEFGHRAYVADELALLLAESAGTTSRWLDDSLVFMTSPAVLAKVGDGTWTVRHADAVLDEISGLAPAEQNRIVELLSRLDKEGNPQADCRTPHQLRGAARAAVVLCDLDAAEKRAQKAKANRSVSMWDNSDGSASFDARGPKHLVAQLMASIDCLALPKEKGDLRTLDQRRFDTLMDLVCGRLAPGQWEAHVLIALSTLEGDNTPAEIPGLGLITASEAREILANAALRRVVVDEDGALVSVDGTVIQPDEADAFMAAQEQAAARPKETDQVEPLSREDQEQAAAMAEVADEAELSDKAELFDEGADELSDEEWLAAARLMDAAGDLEAAFSLPTDTNPDNLDLEVYYGDDASLSEAQLAASLTVLIPSFDSARPCAFVSTTLPSRLEGVRIVPASGPWRVTEDVRFLGRTLTLAWPTATFYEAARHQGPDSQDPEGQGPQGPEGPPAPVPPGSPGGSEPGGGSGSGDSTPAPPAPAGTPSAGGIGSAQAANLDPSRLPRARRPLDPAPSWSDADWHDRDLELHRQELYPSLDRQARGRLAWRDNRRPGPEPDPRLQSSWSLTGLATALASMCRRPADPKPAASAAYIFPPRLARHIGMRDRTCTFPGCPKRIQLCQNDHVVAWPEGPTDVDNAAAECVHHHQAKHHYFTVKRLANGTIRWTGPTGLTADRPPRPLLAAGDPSRGGGARLTCRRQARRWDSKTSPSRHPAREHRARQDRCDDRENALQEGPPRGQHPHVPRSEV